MYSRTLLLKVHRLSTLASPTVSRAGEGVNAVETSAEVGTSSVGSGTSAKENISRLNPRHRLIAEGKIAPVTYEWEKEKWAKCERFGRYGLASGVSPAELWPTVEEIEEQEAFHLYKKFGEVSESVKADDLAQKTAAESRLKQVLKNESKYEERLAKYEASIQKIVEKKSEADEKLEKKIREVQEYFGYWIDPKNPRFEVMFAQKQAEEKKAAKLAKKQELQKKTIAAVTDSSSKSS